jgi:hypothetical protein
MGRELWAGLKGVRLKTEEPLTPPSSAAETGLETVETLAQHPAVQEAMEVFEAELVRFNPKPGR